MNDRGELSYGEAQEAAIELRRETYPGKLNVTYTRGFVSSQAFVDRYESEGQISHAAPARGGRWLDILSKPSQGRGGTGVDGLRGAACHPRGARPGHR